MFYCSPYLSFPYSFLISSCPFSRITPLFLQGPICLHRPYIFINPVSYSFLLFIAPLYTLSLLTPSLHHPHLPHPILIAPSSSVPFHYYLAPPISTPSYIPRLPFRTLPLSIPSYLPLLHILLSPLLPLRGPWFSKPSLHSRLPSTPRQRPYPFDSFFIVPSLSLSSYPCYTLPVLIPTIPVPLPYSFISPSNLLLLPSSLFLCLLPSPIFFRSHLSLPSISPSDSRVPSPPLFSSLPLPQFVPASYLL